MYYIYLKFGILNYNCKLFLFVLCMLFIFIFSYGFCLLLLDMEFLMLFNNVDMILKCMIC